MCVAFPFLKIAYRPLVQKEHIAAMTKPASNPTVPPYQQQVFQFIASVIGQNNIIAIPVEFVRFTGDYNTAAILTQLIYWQGKGNDPDGWIYKTYAEWDTELALSKYQTARAVKILSTMGILKTKVARVKLPGGMYGDKAVHYHFNEVEFVDLFGRHLNPVDSKDPSLSKVKELNYPTYITKTTPKINDDVPAKPQPEKEPPPPLPTPESKSQGQTDTELAIAALVLLIPESLRKPSVIAKLSQSITNGLAIDLIKSCIEYSNDHSHKKTWQAYRSHLGKCLDGGWGAGYSTGDSAAEEVAKDKAFLESRRGMNKSVLIEAARAGCLVSKQVLDERTKQS